MSVGPTQASQAASAISDAAARLRCNRCGARFEMAPLVYGCPGCAKEGIISVLEVEWERRGTPPPLAARKDKGLARFFDLMPGGPPANRITLGEGDTGLVRSRWIGPRLGFGALYFKNETVNPTWSFKDRYVAVSMNLARDFGFKHVVVSSTGNLGVSAAAYCAAAGMRCLFLTAKGAAHAILAQAQLHGALVVATTWDGRQRLFEHLARNRNWFPLGLFLPRPIHNPFGIEGYKTFAYETIEALGEAPVAMLFPCARGNGLYGAWKGYLEAQEWGWSRSLPAMVACQPVGANSLEVSLEADASTPIELPPIQSVAFSTMETVADVYALNAIRTSGGSAFSATDEEILGAQRALAEEGLFVEASSALPIACLTKLKQSGLVDCRRPVVCVVTAAGIKWTDRLAVGSNALIELPPEPAAIDDVLAARGLAN